jgi:hypothetical protein
MAQTAWNTYTAGNTQGRDIRGNTWNGATYSVGPNIYSDWRSSSGQIRRCNSYRVGAQLYTNCN